MLQNKYVIFIVTETFLSRKYIFFGKFFLHYILKMKLCFFL
ncbi:protein of unknown function [Streptococcus thermophilus]|nr:protein of unknown function [Streptococcus thermophilus]CAD0180955.1 protein of unknown function [Streptococcus thermophilus]